MEATIKKCIIKEIKEAEWRDKDLQVIGESIIDTANMSALEILQSKGVQNFEFEMYNCADMIDELSEMLVGKIVSVCEYKFDVSELTDKGTKARVYDCEGEIGVFPFLTLTVPCADDFEPSRSDYMMVEEILKTKLEVDDCYKLIKKEDADTGVISGYVEVDGTIIKVKSIEDLIQSLTTLLCRSKRGI